MSAAGPVKLRSRLAQKLDGEIAAVAAMPARCAVLQVQRAILWLRHGRETEAREELEEYNDYVEELPAAPARAEVIPVDGFLALADAWLAQMDFVGRDIEGLIGHAQAALAALQPTDHAAGCRVATALAMAWSRAAGDDAATPWYAWARQHAIAEGDDAALAALHYNQTLMRALQIRQAVLAGERSEAAAALLSIDSIGRYDDAVGGSARADLTPLLRAQLLTVQGDFAEAAALLQAQLPAATATGLARLGISMLADLAWCWANTGEVLRARALADQAALEAQAEDERCCDIEELAALHARLAQVYARLREDGLAAAQADAATAAWARDAAQRRAWTERLTATGLSSPPR